MFNKIKEWLSDSWLLLLIVVVGFTIVGLICTLEEFLGIVAVTLMFALLVWGGNALGRKICSSYDANKLCENKTTGTEQQAPRSTQWVYISKHNNEEHKISVFWDYFTQTYRVVELNKREVWDMNFDSWEQIRDWISNETDYVIGQCIYERSYREELEDGMRQVQMETEIEEDDL